MGSGELSGVGSVDEGEERDVQCEGEKGYI